MSIFHDVAELLESCGTNPIQLNESIAGMRISIISVPAIMNTSFHQDNTSMNDSIFKCSLVSIALSCHWN